MKKENIANNPNEIKRSWWTVRASLLATLGILLAVLTAMLAPTPLNAWVFGGDALCQLASR